MATFFIPNTFVNGATITADSHNQNWVQIKAFVEGLSSGTNIDNSAISTGKLQDGAVTGDKMATSTITDSNIANSTITLAKLAASLQAYLVPAGTVSATVRSTADTGWLLLDGTPVSNASTLYPALYAATSSLSGWWSGSTFTPPNMANKMLEGKGTTSLGATGGSNSVAIAEGNLPSHKHTVDPPNTAVSISDPGHFHGPNGQYYFVSQVYNGAGTNFASATASYSAPYYGSNITQTDTKTTGISASVDIAQFDSGYTGSGSALTVTNAHLAVNFQIKAH